MKNTGNCLRSRLTLTAGWTEQMKNIQKYASFVAAKCKDENLLPFDRTGIAKVVEYGSRLAEHQEKLSSKFSEINDLIVESNYWALKAKKQDSYERTCGESHKRKSLQEQQNRRADA